MKPAAFSGFQQAVECFNFPGYVSFKCQESVGCGGDGCEGDEVEGG